MLFFLLGLPAMAGWIAIDPETGDCLETHPPQHRLEVARAELKKRDDLATVEAATKERVRRELLASVAAGLTPSQRAAIERAIGVEAAVDRDRGLVCAAALVASEVVHDPGGQAQHAQAVRKLAAQIAQEIGPGSTVGRVHSLWSSGCGVGPAGDGLAAIIRGQLVEQGLQVTDGAGEIIELRLGGGQPLQVEAWHHAQTGATTLMGTAALSAGWLGLHGTVGDQCRDRTALGLAAQQQAGAQGLDLALDFDAHTTLCDGEQMTVGLKPNQPARVQLWSVGRTGEAWLSWDSISQEALPEGRLDQRATITLEAAHVPALGEELLWFVAAPAGSTLPAGPVGCHRASLSRSDFSPTAAIAVRPFRVGAPGRGRCPTTAGTGVSWADYQAAPACE